MIRLMLLSFQPKDHPGTGLIRDPTVSLCAAHTLIVLFITAESLVSAVEAVIDGNGSTPFLACLTDVLTVDKYTFDEFQVASEVHGSE